MALLFPWATKEYLLWDMSLGQLIMYHNVGLELKYPKPPEDSKPSIANMTGEEVKKLRAEAKAMLGTDDDKAEYRRKYGDV
jgi:hypothetical protein